MNNNIFEAFKQEEEIVKSLIQKGEFQYVIKRLEAYKQFSFDSYGRSLDMMVFRVRQLEQEELDGLISPGDVRVQRNRLAKSLLGVLKRLPEDMDLYFRINQTPPVISAANKVTGLERMLTAKTNLKPIMWLSEGMTAADSVGIVRNPEGLGTGFIVGQGYLLTCAHVIPRRELAAQSKISFDYREGIRSDPEEVTFSLDAGTYISSPETDLDYALVKIRPTSDTKSISISTRRRLRVEAGFQATSKQADVLLMSIQHPLGGKMSVGIGGDALLEVRGHELYHQVNTEKGSSGAPIFDHTWKVVGLHNSGLTLAEGGFPIGPGGSPMAANRATLMSAILQDIRSREGYSDFSF